MSARHGTEHTDIYSMRIIPNLSSFTEHLEPYSSMKYNSTERSSKQITSMELLQNYFLTLVWWQHPYDMALQAPVKEAWNSVKEAKSDGGYGHYHPFD